jgi:hypothetical protein
MTAGSTCVQMRTLGVLHASHVLLTHDDVAVVS